MYLNSFPALTPLAALEIGRVGPGPTHTYRNCAILQTLERPWYITTPLASRGSPHACQRYAIVESRAHSFQIDNFRSVGVIFDQSALPRGRIGSRHARHEASHITLSLMARFALVWEGLKIKINIANSKMHASRRIRLNPRSRHSSFGACGVRSVGGIQRVW